MSHTLAFGSIYKSIHGLNKIELPNFVVLTGVNGSGKTHLLEAIQKGNVLSSLTSNPAGEVLLYDWNSIIPPDTGLFSIATEQTQRSKIFQNVKREQEPALEPLRQFCASKGIPASECTTMRRMIALSPEKLEQVLPDPSRAAEIYEELEQQIKALGAQVYARASRHIGGEHNKKAASELAQKRPEVFLATSESKLFDHDAFLWGEVNPFRQAFGRVFSTYRELLHANDRLEKYPPPDDSGKRFLDSREFEERHGPPPWDFVNQILSECHMDFRVDHPPLHETSSYEPKLTKIGSDVEMKFEDLSSGEKVLMSFALCLYNATETQQRKTFPKLLLLDEVDAPLHPSMTASLLSTIQNVLVKDKHVTVILTTHSPSTVALAPEASVFAIDPSGPRIDKITRGAALSLLTEGVPTLSISFDGRRQVFVESRTDAGLYDTLYQNYKSSLGSERSLVFVEVGRTDESGGERNAGCDQVVRIVNDLSNAGNQSVFGLVDWDGQRQAQGRIMVLSPNLRDGLESLLFDPILVTACVVRENKNFAEANGILSPTESYTSLSQWSIERWQNAVDVVQDLVLGVSNSARETLEISYVGGMRLNVARDYLHLDDHELEQKVVGAFGMLIPLNRRAGGLMTHVAETVLTDHRGLLPIDLLDTLKQLLNSEPQAGLP